MDFDREFAKPSNMSSWMKDFANNILKRESANKNPFDEIRNLFQLNSGLSEVEKKVSELSERIGINKLNKSIISTASASSNINIKLAFVKELVKEAEKLERDGNIEAALKLDKMAEDIFNSVQQKNIPEVLKEFPTLKIFIDNVCKSRGGYISIPSIMKMIRDERKEDVIITPELTDYIKEKLEEEKQDITDTAGDQLAGKDVGMKVSKEEQQDSNKMWEPPEAI